MVVVVVIILAVAGLALAALWYRSEPSSVVRKATLGGAVVGFLLALLVALILGQSAINAVAIGLTGAAALAVVLLGQMRMIRSMTTRR